MSGQRPEVIVVGGGFGGLYAARALRGAPVHVTIVDRRNHHLFQPLLYQVATAALNPADIAAPIRSVFRGSKNVSVVLAEAVAVDATARKVVLADGELSYDYLVLATGATHSYFGHDEWTPLAPGLKSIEDALEIRRRVLLAYEMAEREQDAGRRREWMTFVIVGGGPANVGKLNNTREALKIARNSRGILGANGITLEYPIMRHMTNLESVITYEGTEEVHTLVIGEQLTGLKAFT